MKDIKQKFVAYCLAIEDAWQNGNADYRKNNRAMGGLAKLFKNFEKDLETADAVLGELLEHENANVRMGAAVQCLSLRIRTDRAEKTIEQISKIIDDRHLSHNAHMTLNVWRKQGYLKVYPQQMIVMSDDF